MADGLWWRQTWMEAVYGSDLKPLERLVAVVYADHARDRRQVWVTLPRLMERTGLSRDAANRALRGLRDKGWLLVMQEAKQHRATVYGLVIPESSSTPGVPLSSTGDVPLNGSSSTSPDASSTRDDTSSTPRVPNQSSYQNPHQSLSPEQALVRDLLGLDERDERLMKVPQLLADKSPDTPKPWLRRCHENGDLLDLLENVGTTSSAWGTETTDNRMMPNPNYIEGTNEPEVDIEGWHRARMTDLGLDYFAATDFYNDALKNLPHAKPRALWREALINAERDVKENPRCDECRSRLEDGHYRSCSQRERIVCDECSTETGVAYQLGLTACRSCNHKRQLMKESA